MRKTFGSAFALIMVALFTVAPMSPATAAGGIHLHMAGKVGQKAVGTTIIFGAEGVPNLRPARPGDPNGCLTLMPETQQGEKAFQKLTLPGWGTTSCFGSATQVHNVPASGSFAGSEALPALPPGEYSMQWGVFEQRYPDSYLSLTWNFTIGADGTFTALGAVCAKASFATACTL